jgi:predicted Zn-dependent protease
MKFNLFSFIPLIFYFRPMSIEKHRFPFSLKKINKIFFLGILGFIGVWFFLGCQTAPVTGRSQLILISPGEEVQMGLSAYQEVLGKAKLSTDPSINEMVKRVGARIAAVSERPDFEWEFNVIDDDEMINAFALPGGKVAVYTGILPYTKDEDGMATVLGHEVAHALARHGAERISSGILAQIGMVGLNLALEDRDPQVVQSVNAAFGLGVNVGVLLPFNRNQESEADHIGLFLMAKAGYDPRKAVGFWQRMSQTKKEKPPEFLSTHPADERRIRQIQEWLPDMLKVYQTASQNP